MRTILAVVALGIAFSPSLAGESASVAEIEQLIRQLDGGQFAERETAGKKLEAIGEPALLALARATGPGHPPEVRRRAALHLANIRKKLGFRSHEVRCFRGHQASVASVALAADMKLLLSGGGDAADFEKKTPARHCEALLWDMETGRLLREFKGHMAPVLALAFVPDGKRAISSGLDFTLRVWEVDTGKELHCFREFGSRALALAVSADGQRLYSGHRDGEIRVYDLKQGKLLFGQAPLHDTSEDEHLIQRKLIRLDDEKEKKAIPFDRHEGKVLGLCVLDQGRQVLSCGSDHTLRTWEAGSGKQTRVIDLEGHDFYATALALDGKSLFRAAGEHICRTDVGRGTEARLCNIDNKSCRVLAATSDGRRLAVADNTNAVTIVDAVKGNMLAQFDAHDQAITSLLYSPDGQFLVSTGVDKVIRLWHLPSP